jgi:hypothetical protein
MAHVETSEAVVRTQQRYAGMKDYRPNEGQEKSGGMAVMLMAAVLVMGVAGVVIFGPDKAVNVITGLVSSSKAAPQDAAEEPAVVPEPKPAKSTAVRKQPAPPMVVARLAPTSAVPAPGPVTGPARQARPVHVRMGIERRELLELFGTPDMKATSIEDGHLVENYSYLSSSRAQQVIVLKDGRVVATDVN